MKSYDSDVKTCTEGLYCWKPDPCGSMLVLLVYLHVAVL